MERLVKRGRREEGQSLVEFAIIFPVLLFLILGVIEFSWIYLAKIAVNDACREAARIYVVTGDEVQSVTEVEKMTSHLPFLPDHPRSITITEPPEADMAQVVFEGHIRPLVGLFVKADEGADVQLTTVMRMELE